MGLEGLYTILTRLLRLPSLKCSSPDLLRSSISSILRLCCQQPGHRCRAIILDSGFLKYDVCPPHALCGGELRTYARRLDIILTCLTEDFLLPDGKIYVVLDNPSAVFGSKLSCWLERAEERKRDARRVLGRKSLKDARPGHHCTGRVLWAVCQREQHRGHVEMYPSFGEADEAVVFLAAREARKGNESSSRVVILTNDTDLVIHRGLILDHPNVHCFLCKNYRPTIWSRHPVTRERIASVEFFRTVVFPKILEDSDLASVIPEVVKRALEAAGEEDGCFDGMSGEDQWSSLLELTCVKLGREMEVEEERILRQTVATYFVALSEEEMHEMLMVHALKSQDDVRREVHALEEGFADEGFRMLATRVVEAYRSNALFSPSALVLSSRKYVKNFVEVSQLPYFFEEWYRRSIGVLLMSLGWEGDFFVKFNLVGLFGPPVEKIWSVRDEDLQYEVSDLEFIVGGGRTLGRMPLLREDPSFHSIALLFTEWLTLQAKELRISPEDFEPLVSEFALDFLCSIEYPIPPQARIGLRRLGDVFERYKHSYFRGIELFTSFCQLLCDSCEICGDLEIRDVIAEVLMSLSGFDLVALYQKRWLLKVSFDGPGLRSFLEEEDGEFSDPGEVDDDLLLSDPNALPIDSLRQDIVSSIESRGVTIITGPTGCGKSSRVPMMLLSLAHRIRITVTCPTRVSATSLARYVGSKFSNRSVVGFQIGGTHRPGSKITYVTVGVLQERLLREKRNRTRSRAGQLEIVIVDEVHERTIETDTVLYLLRRKLRRERRRCRLEGRPSLFRVVLMSATVDTGPLQAYFEESRQNEGKENDGEEEEEEGEMVCRRLRERFRVPILSVPNRLFHVKVAYLDSVFEWIRIREDSPEWITTKRKIENTLPKSKGQRFVGKKRFVRPNVFELISGLAVRLIAALHDFEPTEHSMLVFLPGIAGILALERRLWEALPSESVSIFIMHSCVPMEEQIEAFRDPKEGIRKIVLATNIAESSITIPDVHFVLDFCLCKILDMDPQSGAESLMMEWASKENLDQRKGRAGRVQNGVCFRLMLEDCWNALPDYLDPEILRLSLSSLVLKLMKMKIGISVEDTLKKFVTRPTLVKLARAYNDLEEMGAVALSKSFLKELTPFGLLAAELPVSLCGSKLIFLGVAFGFPHECILLASLLDSGGIFFAGLTKFLENLRARYHFGKGTDSDLFANYYAFLAWRNRGPLGGHRRRMAWCGSRSIFMKLVLEVEARLRMIYGRLSKRHALSLSSPEYSLAELRTDETSLLILRILVGGAYQRNLVRMSTMKTQHRAVLPEDFEPSRSGFIQCREDDQVGETFEEKVRSFIEDFDGGMGRIEKFQLLGNGAVVEFCAEEEEEGERESRAPSGNPESLCCQATFLAQRLQRKTFERLRLPPDSPFLEMPYDSFCLKKIALLSSSFFANKAYLARSSLLRSQFMSDAPSSFDFVFGSHHSSGFHMFLSMNTLLPPGMVDILILLFASKLRQAPEMESEGYWEVVHNGMVVLFRPEVSFAVLDRILSLRECLSSFRPFRVPYRSLKRFQDTVLADLQAIIDFRSISAPKNLEMGVGRMSFEGTSDETVVLRQLYRKIVSYVADGVLDLRVRLYFAVFLRNRFLAKNSCCLELVRSLRPGQRVVFNLKGSWLRVETIDVPSNRKMKPRVKKLLRFHLQTVLSDLHSVRMEEEKGHFLGLSLKPKSSISIVPFCVRGDRVFLLSKGNRKLLTIKQDMSTDSMTAVKRFLATKVFSRVSDRDKIHKLKRFFGVNSSRIRFFEGSSVTFAFCAMPSFDQVSPNIWQEVTLSGSKLIHRDEDPSSPLIRTPFPLLDHFRHLFRRIAGESLDAHVRAANRATLESVLLRIVEFFFDERICSVSNLKLILATLSRVFDSRLRRSLLNRDDGDEDLICLDSNHSLVFPSSRSTEYLFDGVLFTFNELGQRILDIILESLEYGSDSPHVIRVLKSDRSIPALRLFFSRLMCSCDELVLSFLPENFRIVMFPEAEFLEIRLGQGVEDVLSLYPPAAIPPTDVSPPKGLGKKKLRRWKRDQKKKRIEKRRIRLEWERSVVEFSPARGIQFDSSADSRTTNASTGFLGGYSLVQKILSYVSKSRRGKIFHFDDVRSVSSLELALTRIILSFLGFSSLARDKNTIQILVREREGIWCFGDYCVHQSDVLDMFLCAVRSLLVSQQSVLHLQCFFERRSYFSQFLRIETLRSLVDSSLVSFHDHCSLRYCRISVVNMLHPVAFAIDEYFNAIGVRVTEDEEDFEDFSSLPFFDFPSSGTGEDVEFVSRHQATLFRSHRRRGRRRKNPWRLRRGGSLRGRLRSRFRGSSFSSASPRTHGRTCDLKPTHILSSSSSSPSSSDGSEPDSVSSDDEFKCFLCGVNCRAELNFKQHLRGKRHLSNLERTKETSLNDVVSHEGSQTSDGDAEEEEFTCVICHVDCGSKGCFAQHQQGKKHRRNLQKAEESITPVPNSAAEAVDGYCALCECQCPGSFKQHLGGKKHIRNLLSEEDEAEDEVEGEEVDGSDSFSLAEAIPQERSTRDLNPTSILLSASSVPLKESGGLVLELSFCSMCGVRCPNAFSLEQHLRGRKHQSHLQRAESIIPVPNSVAEALDEYCALCECQCPGSFKQHLGGKRHIRNLLRKEDEAEGEEVNGGDSFSLAEAIPQERSTRDLNPTSILLSGSSVPLKSKFESGGLVPELSCSLCGIRCPNTFSLEHHLRGKRHLRQVSEQSKAASDLIVDPTELHSSLDRPKEPVEPEQNEYCEICDLSLLGQADYDVHIKGRTHRRNLLRAIRLRPHHGDLKPSNFLLPPSSSPSSSNGSESDSAHPSDDEFSCSLCDVGCLNAFSLEQHLRGKKHLRAVRVHQSSPTEELFRCSLCDVNCQSESTFEDHVRGKRHLQNLLREGEVEDEVEVYCEKCEVSLPNNAEYDLHLKGTEHKRAVSSIFCELCQVWCPRGSYEMHVNGKKHLRNLET